MKNKILSLASLLAVSMIIMTVSSCKHTTPDNTREDIILVKYYGNPPISYLGLHNQYVVIPMFALMPAVNDTTIEFKRYLVIEKNDNSFQEWSDIAKRNTIDHQIANQNIAKTMYQDLYTPLSGIQDQVSIVQIASSETHEIGIRTVRGVSGKGSGYYKTKVKNKNGQLYYVAIQEEQPIVGDYYIYDNSIQEYNYMPRARKLF